MLSRLVRSDYILHWKSILPLPITAFGLLIYHVLRDGPDLNVGFFMTMGALMAGFGPIIIAGREDKQKTRVLMCSLPVRRTAIVAARYLGSVFVFFAFAALMILVLLIARGPGVIRDIFKAPVIFGMLVTFSLVVGLMMPFVMRFGLNGVLVFLAAIQVVGLLVLVLPMVLQGRPQWIDLVIAAIGGFTRSTREGLGSTWYFLIVAVVLAGFNGASFVLSAAVFRRREL